MPLVKITQAISADTVWSKSLSSADGFLVPAVYDDVVFAAGGKTLSRMNARSGEVEWSVSFDSPITAGVGSDGYVTAVGLEDGTLQVVDAEGKVSWSKKLTTDLASPPVVAHGLVIVRTLDTRVSAFEASSGDEEWIYQKNQPALTVRLPTGMLAHDTVLFVGQPNGHVVILDIPTGKAVFEFSIAQSKGITEVERLVDVVGYPAFSQDLVCAAAYQGALTCIDSQNGQTRWSQPLDAVADLPLTKTTFMESRSTAKSKRSIAKAERNAGRIRKCSTADFLLRSLCRVRLPSVTPKAMCICFLREPEKRSEDFV